MTMLEKIETPFSLEHHAYARVPGRIDRKIYEHLLQEGLSKQTWVVRADFDYLEKLHLWKQKYTQECLGRLKKYGLLVPIGESRASTLYLVPVLKDYVKEPQAFIEEAEEVRQEKLKAKEKMKREAYV